MSYIIKSILILIIAVSLLYVFSLSAMAALNFGDAPGLTGTGAREAGISLADDPAVIAAVVVQAILGLVGMIFFIYFIYGGFKYMIAAGSDQKVQDARKIIIHAVIGLAIITVAYSISFFIVSNLENAASTDQKPNQQPTPIISS